MKTLSILMLALAPMLGMAQVSISVANNTCETKIVRVFLDDYYGTCTGRVGRCTPQQVIVKTVTPGSVVPFTASCPGSYLYRIEAQSTATATTAVWTSRCGSPSNGNTPASSSCPGPLGKFTIVMPTMAPPVFNVNNI